MEYCKLDSKAKTKIVLEGLHSLYSIHLENVTSQKKSQLWNEYIHRYHYLGYTLRSVTR